MHFPKSNEVHKNLASSTGLDFKYIQQDDFRTKVQLAMQKVPAPGFAHMYLREQFTSWHTQSIADLWQEWNCNSSSALGKVTFVTL